MPSAMEWRAGSSSRKFIPPRFAAAGCPSLRPRFGSWATWATNVSDHAKASGIGWHLLAFQRRRTFDGCPSRLAGSRDQRPVARGDHEIVDGRKIGRGPVSWEGEALIPFWN